MNQLEILLSAWLSGLIQIVPYIVIGALAGLGLFLRSPGEIKFRFLVGHLIQGGLLGLVSGLLLAMLWPDKRNDALVAAGIVAAISQIGTDRIRKILIFLLRRKIDPEDKYKEIFEEPDSLELLREKLGTGGYSLEEIQAAIAEYKERKQHESPDRASVQEQPAGSNENSLRPAGPVGTAAGVARPGQD